MSCFSVASLVSLLASYVGYSIRLNNEHLWLKKVRCGSREDLPHPVRDRIQNSFAYKDTFQKLLLTTIFFL
ncbi:hypothetical protein LDENG_00236850 [Lucifuga dentata]|nr:hypothetical protein LDENG_00236850 [Lucifuga dentata]